MYYMEYKHIIHIVEIIYGKKSIIKKKQIQFNTHIVYVIYTIIEIILFLKLNDIYEYI